jgi:hypothetical protein
MSSHVFAAVVAFVVAAAATAAGFPHAGAAFAAVAAFVAAEEMTFRPQGVLA